MTTQHTPGEWRTVKHATPEHSPQYGVCSEDGRDLATFTGPNAKANATLAASAPAILAALADILPRYEALIRDADNGNGQPLDGEAQAIARAHAALFRAEA